MKTEEFLKDVELFSGLSEKNLSRVAKLCSNRSFRKGDYVVHQGKPGVGLFLITSGKVKVVKSTKEEGDIEIATHGPGDFIGEMSVLDGAVRTANVVAIEDTDCLVLVSWDFNSLMKSYPDIALEILPVIVKRFRETNEKLLGLHVGGETKRS